MSMKTIKNLKSQITQQNISRVVLLALFIQLVAPFMLGTAQAATLTNTYLRLNRMKSGTATSFRLVFTNITAATNSVVVDFNGTDTGTARWTDAANGPGLIGASGSQVSSIATCPGETSTTGIPGTLTPSSSGSTITVATSSTMSASTAYCVDLTFASAVTTPTTAAEYHPTVTTKTGGSATDSTNIALRIITGDQVTVNATVPPTFNFVLSGTTDNFTANLSTSSTISTTGTTITLTTNAPNGWVVWARDLNSSGGKGALNSATASNYKITSSTAIGAASHAASAGVEDYGLGVTINTDAGGGGTVSLDAAYDGTSTKLGTLDPAILRPIASANGTANGDIINLNERAMVAGQTPAASDYTDTITFVGAGRF